MICTICATIIYGDLMVAKAQGFRVAFKVEGEEPFQR